MGVKIPPSEVVRQEISRLQDGVFEGVSNPLDSFVRLAARFKLQMGMETEVKEFLGRATTRGVAVDKVAGEMVTSPGG